MHWRHILFFAFTVGCSATPPTAGAPAEGTDATTPGAASPSAASPTSAEPAPPATAEPTPAVQTPGSSATTPVAAETGEGAAIASTNDFTLAMLRKLETEKDNVFFSGTSLRTALGMTALGAAGPTLDEMTKALHLSADPNTNVLEAKREAEEWKRAASKAELNVANRLFVDKSFPLNQSFVERTQRGYQASSGQVDFVHATEPTRALINAWVSDRTKKRISNLLPPGSLTADTRLVLTNAIYFKGSWTKEFPKQGTQPRPFAAPSGAVSVPTMHLTSRMPYAQNDEVRLVELPYKDSDLSMLIVLPTEEHTVSEVVKSLTSQKLEAWTKSLHVAEVALALPKLEFAWGRSVKGELKELGIREAFSLRADFSGISPRGASELYIDDVFHKGFVLVDEKGTEAAAATGVVMNLKSARREPIELKVDRPFLFFVQNTKTGEILFAGRVLNPVAA